MQRPSLLSGQVNTGKLLICNRLNGALAGCKFVNLCIFSRYRSHLPTCDEVLHTTKEVLIGKKPDQSLVW